MVQDSSPISSNGVGLGCINNDAPPKGPGGSQKGIFSEGSHVTAQGNMATVSYYAAPSCAALSSSSWKPVSMSVTAVGTCIAEGSSSYKKYFCSSTGGVVCECGQAYTQPLSSASLSLQLSHYG